MQKRIAKIGDIISVVTTNNEVFVGYLSHLFSIIDNNGQIDTEIMLSEHSSHKKQSYGAVCLPMSYIKSVTLVQDYSVVKATNQDLILNIDKIQLLMNEKNISKAELARGIGKDKSVISKIMLGQSCDVSLSTAVGIAKKLNVSVDEIINK